MDRLRPKAHAGVTHVSEHYETNPELIALLAIAWTLGPEVMQEELRLLGDRVKTVCDAWNARLAKMTPEFRQWVTGG